MTPIPATQAGLAAFEKRGPASRSFVQFMKQTGRVQIVEQNTKKEN